MRDEECVAFLQWALPQLRARWPGFRKVRRQVCKRVVRRLETLALPDVSAYRAYLEANADEWPYLDELCRIPISRFYRDRAVFAYLADRALLLLAQAARDRGATRLRAWSAGCGAGEEPYTLRLVWQFSLQPRFPGLDLQILATDIDRQQLARTEVACYSRGSLKELPAAWIQAAFEERGGGQCLRPEFRAGIEFRRQDIRRELPGGAL